MKLTITEVSPEQFKEIITEGDPVEPVTELQAQLERAQAISRKAVGGWDRLQSWTKEPSRREAILGGDLIEITIAYAEILEARLTSALATGDHFKEWVLDLQDEACGLEAQLELWRKSEEGTLAQMAETNERFEGALSKIEELQAQLADINTRLRAACIEQEADESVLTDPADWLIRYTRRLARGLKVEIARAHTEGRREVEAQLANCHETMQKDGQRHARALLALEDAEAQLASAHARIEAIDNALDDASAPEATEAQALDNDPIIERIKLWKYAQDELGDQLAEATERAEAAEKRLVAFRNDIAANLGISGELRKIYAERDAANRRAEQAEAQLKEVQGNWKKYEPMALRMQAAEARAADLAKALEQIHEIAANHADNYAREADAMPRVFDIAHMALNPDAREEGKSE